MKCLLDTHVWLWMDERPEELGPACRKVLENTDVEILVSSISVLEIGQLLFVEKLGLRTALDAWMKRSLAELQMSALDMTPAIAARAYTIPGTFHRDPADRILVSTAIEYGLTLVTADRRILDYAHVQSIDARK